MNTLKSPDAVTLDEAAISSAGTFVDALFPDAASRDSMRLTLAVADALVAAINRAVAVPAVAVTGALPVLPVAAKAPRVRRTKAQIAADKAAAQGNAPIVLTGTVVAPPAPPAPVLPIPSPVPMSDPGIVAAPAIPAFVPPPAPPVPASFAPPAAASPFGG